MQQASAGTARRRAWTLVLGITVALSPLLVPNLPAREAAAFVGAATFTVNSTLDYGDSTPDGVCDSAPTFIVRCTLREAIQEANASPGADLISFNIPGTGVHTIAPLSALPQIAEAVDINGYLQPGASPNTLSAGTNAVLRIELSGANTPANTLVDGLLFGASNIAVHGLAINRFWIGIDIFWGHGNQIAGNFLGTDPSGTQDRGNNFAGVDIRSQVHNAIIGGTLPAARNLISGNGTVGVSIETGNPNAQPTGNKVIGNLIGTAKDGSGNLGNSLDGVSILEGSANTIGGNTAEAANTIAFNGRNGVRVIGATATGNRILRNSIFANNAIGIELGGDGPTLNDKGDGDVGPNDLQNKPVLTAITTSTISGKLNSTPNQTFVLRFFANPGGNAGTTFLGKQGVTTNANGNAVFAFSPARAVPTGQLITATATSSSGNTSEFSVPEFAP